MLQLQCGLQGATHGGLDTLAFIVQITQFLPTHCERCDGTIDGAVRWLRAGGNIDMTAGDQVQGSAGIDAWMLLCGRGPLRLSEGGLVACTEMTGGSGGSCDTYSVGATACPAIIRRAHRPSSSSRYCA